MVFPTRRKSRSKNAIFALRAKHPSWGARKLKARLEMLQSDMLWPAASTFGNILSRAGLTSPQRKRKRTTPCSEPFSLVTGPNQLWCMDFKGYFDTGDGRRCDPFTITDAHSRYLIRCQIASWLCSQSNDRHSIPSCMIHPLGGLALQRD
jgi:transposase InsO family protein